jgi:hypothetical protein
MVMDTDTDMDTVMLTVMLMAMIWTMKNPPGKIGKQSGFPKVGRLRRDRRNGNDVKTVTS